MLSTVARFARPGFAALSPEHTALVDAAEAALGGPLPTREDASFGAAVVSGRGAAARVLLVHQRTATGMHWSIPKGHAEAGEDAVGAAVRELNEETGVGLARGDVLASRFVESAYTFCGPSVWGAAWAAHAAFPDEARRPRAVTFKTTRYFLARLQGDALPSLTLQADEVAAAEWLRLDDACARLTFPREGALLRDLFAGAADELA
jgi:8-oxo-dGTP pyrophosphatase MutT (NUDIX family)